MQKLPEGCILVTSITPEAFTFIKSIIATTELSSYLLDAQDFFAVKNKQDHIIAFGRLYCIGEHCKEVSSLRVDPKYRGQKIGLYLTQQLLQQKRGDDEVYLATKESLAQYYEQLHFHAIDKDIPEKLIYTSKRAQEHGIVFVIMKLENFALKTLHLKLNT